MAAPDHPKSKGKRYIPWWEGPVQGSAGLCGAARRVPARTSPEGDKSRPCLSATLRADSQRDLYYT